MFTLFLFTRRYISDENNENRVFIIRETNILAAYFLIKNIKIYILKNVKYTMTFSKKSVSNWRKRWTMVNL